jgi:hypothetical protein
MDCDRLASLFGPIVELVRSNDDPESCWAGVLEITGQTSNATLASLEIESDLLALITRARGILAAEPISPEATFLWFGLFDLRIQDKEVEGYYISGWTGINPDIRRQRAYWPEGRYLTSNVLDSVKSEIVRIANQSRLAKKELPLEYHMLDYAIMFGAAALLTKFIIRGLAIELPVYVGFDSGDWALIANTPSDSAGAKWPIIPARAI